MRKFITIIILTITAVSAWAQADRQYIREGNRLFRSQQYEKAEVAYRKALTKNSRNPQAMYNLGLALLRQQKDSDAVVQFQNAMKTETAPKRKAMVCHNIGWVCQKHQLYSDAVNAYKESLRNNPTDNETRYNLALCMRQLKNQQQNNKNDDKKKNKDKDKDQKDKQQQDKDKNKQDQKDKQKKQEKEKMSKDNAEQLLNAAIQQENATQQRLQKAMQQPRSRKLQKNW